MPIRQQELINNEIYHIVLRGVGDSLIFKDINDYYRGIFSLYEFNNINSVNIGKRRREIQTIKKLSREQAGRSPSSPISVNIPDKRDLLVEIFTFCFMPNHIHLLIKQTKDEGITKFMRKFGTGYANYFNKKYNRKGYLFQGRFKTIHIKTDRQLKIVFVYIHTNPISLIEPKWKEIGIKNMEKVIEFLKNYKWSSYSDYLGKKNFPSVTERNSMLKAMGGEQGCKDFIENWVKYKGEIKKFSNFVLE